MTQWRVYMTGLGAYRVGRRDRTEWHPVARVFPTAQAAQEWLDLEEST